MTNQRNVFLQGEGDAYEQRNLGSTGLSPALLDRIARHPCSVDRVLEIGFSLGDNLRAFDGLVRGRSSVDVLNSFP